MSDRLIDIAFITADWGKVPRGEIPPPGGAGWVRIHQPAMQLAEHDHTVVIGAGVASRPDGLLVPLGHDGQPLMLEPEIVVIQRWMHAEAADAIRTARKAGQIIVQDVDDWFWGLHEGNRAYYITDPKVDPTHNRDHYKAAIEASDAVTVSTGFLARRLRERMGVRVALLRNCVDPAAFATTDVRNVSDGLVIGWTGALQWRSGDLETMRDVLPAFCAETGSTFVHHGLFPGEPAYHAAALIGLPPEATGPSKRGLIPQDYPANVAGFDIGIVPLNDVPFNHAKSWIKGLEYAAAGIPFVAFRTAEYEALGCGLLASTPDEWRHQLDRLRDPTLRAEQQRLGLEAAQDWSIRRRWPAWEAFYQELVEFAPSSPTRGAEFLR